MVSCRDTERHTSTVSTVGMLSCLTVSYYRNNTAVNNKKLVNTKYHWQAEQNGKEPQIHSTTWTCLSLSTHRKIRYCRQQNRQSQTNYQLIISLTAANTNYQEIIRRSIFNSHFAVNIFQHLKLYIITCSFKYLLKNDSEILFLCKTSPVKIFTMSNKIPIPNSFSSISTAVF